MNFEVKIPPMGESISSGVLAKWHVKDGDIVKKDQPLFELETDKITSEGTAESAGKISLKVAAGTEVKIGELVATIDSAASAGTAAPAPTPAAPAAVAKDAVASPAVRRLAEETGINPAAVSGTGGIASLAGFDSLTNQAGGRIEGSSVEGVYLSGSAGVLVNAAGATVYARVGALWRVALEYGWGMAGV